MKILKRVSWFLAMAGFLLILAAGAYGQQAVNARPDYETNFSLTAAGRASGPGNILDNRFLGCTTFQVSFTNDSLTAYSLQADEALSVLGVPGSWSKFGTAIGTVPTGTALPFTQVANPSGGAFTVYKNTPFVSVNLNSTGGSGTITGSLKCWRPFGQQDANATAGNVVNQGNAPWLATINGPAATDNVAATVFTPRASLRVELEPTQIFIDTFDSGLDTTAKWSATNGGVGSAAPTNGGVDGGSTTLSGGTALNAFSLLKSLNKFGTTEPGYLYVTMRVNVENPVLTTGYRFFGLGTTPASPTIANPVIDGVGFDITLTGHLRAVTYAGSGGTTGAVTVIKDLFGAGQPTDANAHKYFIWSRGDTGYWSIDTFDNVVASFLTGASGPNVNTLPLTALVVSNSGTTETLVVNAVAVGDTARNATFISGTDNPALGIVPQVSPALETNHVFKASPGSAYSICATIGATSGYLMLFNATSAPVDGAVTPAVIPLYIPTLNATANSGCYSWRPGPPAVFSVGITAVFSTTGTFTKTAANATFSGDVK